LRIMKHILDSIKKENETYEITKAVVSGDTSILSLDIRLNFIVPMDEVRRIKQSMMEEIPGLTGVDITFDYQEVAWDRDRILDLFIEHMIELVNGKYSVITKTIFTKEHRVEEDTLLIFALGDTAVEKLNQEVAPKFSQLLARHFSIQLKVKFLNHKERYENNFKELERHDRLPAPSPVRQARAEAPKEKNQRKLPANRLMGKAVDGEPVPISSLTANSGQVVVRGSIFEINARTVKSNKKLVTLLLSDATSSLCAKMFISDEKWDHIEKNLEEDDVVLIRGEVQWDNFSNDIILMAKDMEKGKRQLREDSAETKRVELHAHTKMSAMDGLNDPTALVRMAADWGHRAIAITDHGVVQAFPDAFHAAKKAGIKILYGLEGYLFDDKDSRLPNGEINIKGKDTSHVILIAKNQIGLKNLYKLVSLSHLKYFYKKPRIPRSVLESHREGLLVGSACVEGEVFKGVVNRYSDESLRSLVDFYDYLEIQPLCNNHFLIDKGIVSDEKGLQTFNEKIVALGKAAGKPVVATCDAHYASPEESLYRQILMAGQGYKDIEGDKGLYLRTTDEMLAEFMYLGEEQAREVVIEAPNRIAEMVDSIRPVPKGKFPPQIENSDITLRNRCQEAAMAIYGDPLPELIKARLDRELNSIINNGYAVMYVAAEMLVQKSMQDGYLVGSRGSVGSSFAATMAGITEVNPLPPHYICPTCKYLEWGDEALYDCGVDMPSKTCPSCGTMLDQNGFSIRFETFLGFEGDKEPDIDLNFAGEYQPRAHKYVEEIFGKENVFRAGTIGTIASKTAYGFVKKYFEERGLPVNKYEIERLTKCCSGVRRTTGQHPGGIIIVPKGHDIHEFCPVQHPANDGSTETITTHFDYHSIDENLLKLDILGHDNPSMIRQLQDMTGADPLKVPLKDERVNSIFIGIEGLGIKEPDYRFSHGSFGIPEFGTRFVRQMLDDTKPNKFADLVRISGFSHGTNVWINNAQEFIRSGEATMKDAISTRDDIMNYLILKGLPNKESFTIMEKVRKGKGVSEEEETLMRQHGVPNWYIESCKRIEYMFPRAHAVAYVMMSYRIAYYKVYYPVEFYAVYFTTKVADFNWNVIQKGSRHILDRIDFLELKGRNATKKEEDEVTVLEVAYEMYSRGFQFESPKLGESRAVQFALKNGKIQVPLCALDGVGENAGRAIEEAFFSAPFATVDDLRERTRVNKTAIEALRNCGALDGIQESDQMSLL
jgi:DNA polymerase III subunit alpha, Gram-positive type